MNCRKTTFIWLQLFPGCPSTVAVKRSTDGEKKCEQRRGVARRLSCRSQTFLFLWSCACGQLSSNVHRDDQAHDGEDEPGNDRRLTPGTPSARSASRLVFLSLGGFGCSAIPFARGTNRRLRRPTARGLWNAFGVYKPSTWKEDYNQLPNDFSPFFLWEKRKGKYLGS